MEAIKYLICQKCGSNYKHSLGEMTARQFNTYINHDDRHEKPYSVIYCEFDKKKYTSFRGELGIIRTGRRIIIWGME